MEIAELLQPRKPHNSHVMFQGRKTSPTTSIIALSHGESPTHPLNSLTITLRKHGDIFEAVDGFSIETYLQIIFEATILNTHPE
jgi:hypothetical protein